MIKLWQSFTNIQTLMNKYNFKIVIKQRIVIWIKMYNCFTNCNIYLYNIAMENNCVSLSRFHDLYVVYCHARHKLY